MSIHDELRAALAAPTPEQDQELINLGVPAEIVWFVGAANIRPSGRLYEPDEDGTPAWVIPVIDEGDVVDLLALTTDPVRWWTRLGEAGFVGGDVLGEVVMGEPVRLFKTAMSWLRSSAPADGLVVLDWDTARRELALFTLGAEDLEHGETLQKKLTIPAVKPEVLIPRLAA